MEWFPSSSGSPRLALPSLADAVASPRTRPRFTMAGSGVILGKSTSRDRLPLSGTWLTGSPLMEDGEGVRLGLTGLRSLRSSGFSTAVSLDSSICSSPSPGALSGLYVKIIVGFWVGSSGLASANH